MPFSKPSPNPTYQVVGDPTEGALAVRGAGLLKAQMEEALPRG